ncbi:hypothetical protein PENSPDRAFT_673245 [Peniophora sp. CONT]|nr:hypothetical protein PENSPDRAFT_673245 [Peniophora sp. CONT]
MSVNVAVRTISFPLFLILGCRPGLDNVTLYGLTVRRTANPRALDYSQLPTELWLIILREATVMFPDPLDTSVDLSFLEAHPLDKGVYAASMRTKQALSLVSKSWNSLIKMYHYEFVWISRAAQAKALAHFLLLEYFAGRPSSGAYIRRLHIETPVLERCAIVDLHTILEHAPQLSVYTDHQSLQRNRFDIPPDPRCEPEKLLSLLAHPRSELRRLSWTSYEDAPFHQRMSPLMDMRTRTLEYLELSSCSPNFRALVTDADGAAAMRVRLPALKSLKVTLDNDMFGALAAWELPALRNLSVLSADFSYTGKGFYRFFTAHGAALRQLELGHSSSLVGEHYVTNRPGDEGAGGLCLARMCPNLRELICSADAEWHWESPDWIAPHVLLPCHPRLELIAVRDMDARIEDALAHQANGNGFFPLLEQMSSLLQPTAFPQLKYIRDLSVASALRREAERAPAPMLTFWRKVLDMCAERGVWLEDYRGVNITARELKRLEMRAISGGRHW